MRVNSQPLVAWLCATPAEAADEVLEFLGEWSTQAGELIYPSELNLIESGTDTAEVEDDD